MEERFRDAAAELTALATEVETAAEVLLTAAEKALATVAAAKGLSPEDRAALEGQLQAMLAACAFQDLSGQRLTKVRNLIFGDEAFGGELENGPARLGEGLDQAAADALFAKAG